MQTDQSKVKMVAGEAKTKLEGMNIVDYNKTTLGHTKINNDSVKEEKIVKVKVLHPIRISRPAPNGKIADTVVQPGFTADITESEAAEYCDKEFKGVASFRGERMPGDETYHSITRAKRIS